MKGVDQIEKKIHISILFFYLTPIPPSYQKINLCLCHGLDIDGYLYFPLSYYNKKNIPTLAITGRQSMIVGFKNQCTNCMFDDIANVSELMF